MAFAQEIWQILLRILLYRGEEQIMKDGILLVPVERYLKGLVPGKRLPESQWLHN